MELLSLLEKKKSVILKEWLAAIFATYPDDTAKFLKDGADLFSNPVGHSITTNAEYILEGLIRGEDTDAILAYIEPIIRIRAVQDFTPAQAASFINSLKPVLLHQIESEISGRSLWDEWEELHSTIDNLSLAAFELFGKMNERIEHIRMKEIENNERFLIKLMGNRPR